MPTVSTSESVAGALLPILWGWVESLSTLRRDHSAGRALLATAGSPEDLCGNGTEDGTTPGACGASFVELDDR